MDEVSWRSKIINISYINTYTKLINISNVLIHLIFLYFDVQYFKHFEKKEKACSTITKYKYNFGNRGMINNILNFNIIFKI